MELGLCVAVVVVWQVVAEEDASEGHDRSEMVCSWQHCCMKYDVTVYWDSGEIYKLVLYLTETAVNGVFQIFCKKPYVTFKDMLVVPENVKLIRE